ncbi:MAG: hypothetical protein DRO15_06435 [Thermoprotei archaeon]|nr:MAG: hypothetical protein DRO15_06435 [Thermoprotei archaeon]
MTLGHEIVGVADEIGDKALGDLIGGRVTTEINVYWEMLVLL